MAAFLTVFQHPVLVLDTFSFACPFGTLQPIVLTDWKIEVCRQNKFNIRGITDYERFFFFFPNNSLCSLHWMCRRKNITEHNFNRK